MTEFLRAAIIMSDRKRILSLHWYINQCSKPISLRAIVKEDGSQVLFAVAADADPTRHQPG